MRRFAIALALAASACAPMQWVKQDASAAEAQADEQECQQSAWREAQFRSWHYYTMLGPVFARDASGRGLLVWPTTPMVDPYGHQLMEESRLAQYCMESKGYRLESAPRN
jgi:hypothetical protein